MIPSLTDLVQIGTLLGMLSGLIMIGRWSGRLESKMDSFSRQQTRMVNAIEKAERSTDKVSDALTVHINDENNRFDTIERQLMAHR